MNFEHLIIENVRHAFDYPITVVTGTGSKEFLYTIYDTLRRADSNDELYLNTNVPVPIQQLPVFMERHPQHKLELFEAGIQSLCNLGSGDTGIILIEDLELGVPVPVHVTLLDKLRVQYPKIQFVVTTNSGVVIAGASLVKIMGVGDHRPDPNFSLQKRGITYKI